MHFRAFFIAALFVLACAVPASASKRVALVIGNEDYKHVPRLDNPVNDAAAMARTFSSAGFEVVDSSRNLSSGELRQALREFAIKAEHADIAVIYYAGHGIEVEGVNYLIPVDAKLQQETDIHDEAVGLDRVLLAVEPVKKLRLVILDACRENPFARTMKRRVATRSIGRGLARVEPTNPNTMIAFAAKAGSMAADGSNAHSPFATALMNHLTRPGLDLRKAFGYVRDEVLMATGNSQEPFVYGSLGGDDVSLVPAPPGTTAAADMSEVRLHYELAERIGTTAVWDAFIAKYPKDFYTEAARAQRSRVQAEAERQAATERAKAAEQKKAQLAANGARPAEQAQAAAVAKAAEDARLAAETKAAEEARLADAERAKSTNLAAQAATVPAGQVASLAPTLPAGDARQAGAVTVARELQGELRRLGCFTGTISDGWSDAAQRSLRLFNRHAGATLEIGLASLDALDAVRGKTGRICPMVCERGYKPDGERCTKITCGPGYVLGDNNSCEKLEKTPARRAAAPDSAKPQAAAPSRSAVGEQIICTAAMGGCRPVKKGCRIAEQAVGAGITQIEVCN